MPSLTLLSSGADRSYVAVVVDTIIKICKFLNQAHAWFLNIASVHKSMFVCVCVCVFACVCPPPRLLITSGVMWCDIDPIRLVE